MDTPDIYTAIADLGRFPELPFVEHVDLTLLQIYEREDQAERLIRLAAHFSMALQLANGDQELQRRTVLLSNLTEPGSKYDDLCEACYKRISQEFDLAYPDKNVDVLTVNELTHGDRPERYLDIRILWSDVEKYLGSKVSVLWYPVEMMRYCSWLTDVLGYPELITLGYRMGKLKEQIESHHLWGCFLLHASRDAIYSLEKDATRYRNLVATIAYRQGAIIAIKNAAEDILTAWQVDAENLTPNQQEILLAMLELGAISITTRKKSDQIAKKAWGSRKSDSARRLIAGLGKLDLVDTKEGPTGGCFLTPRGQTVAGKMKERNDDLV
jgi:hypothetical protein